VRAKDIIAGLELLYPYYDDPEGFHNGAEHDEFYAYPTSRPLSDEDLGKMIALEWHQEYYELDYSKDFAKEDYRSDESWVCYT